MSGVTLFKAAYYLVKILNTQSPNYADIIIDRIIKLQKTCI